MDQRLISLSYMVQEQPRNDRKCYSLYVIKLNQGKYYVGITARKDPNIRIEQHKHGFYSAQWVKKYGYLRTVMTKDLGLISQSQAERLENKYTIAS